MFRKKITSLSIAVILLLIIPLNQSCQRDDICPASTSTTPIINIVFFDAEEEDIPRPPVNLRVRSLDPDTIIFNRLNVSEISLPLRTDVDITEYEFTIYAPEIPAEGEEEVPQENTNADVINFTYSRNEVYVNRACSYKVEYLGLQADLEQDNNRWINRLTVEMANIVNETDTTHISIYH